MSDFRSDPNFVHHEMNESDSRVQWAAVAVILLLVGGMIFAAAYSGGSDSQTAMNSRPPKPPARAARRARRRRCRHRRVSCDIRLSGSHKTLRGSPGVCWGFLFCRLPVAGHLGYPELWPQHPTSPLSPAACATATAPCLARAITLIESKRADHQNKAHQLVQELLPDTGKAIRVGITGAPGVGKSLTIDTLGTHLTGQGHRVAVLAVDPSSTRTGGSILGDKTRMARLAVDDNAFVRPSPSSGTLGGVAAKTRETMLLCEAAGFDVALVETVGIGQSETTVADMTDFFLALMLPGAGDELQGIKKGLVELADMIAVNKADGDNVKRANTAAAEYRGALHILTRARRTGRRRC